MRDKTVLSTLSYNRNSSDRPVTDTLRVAELACVTTFTVCMLSMLNHGSFSNTDLFASWLFFPLVLVGAALASTRIRVENLNSLGINLIRPTYSLKLLSITCLAALPLTALGLWTLSRLGVALPGHAVIKPDKWINWAVYQFLYVAVAEEIFFRGYVLNSLLQLKPSLAVKKPRTWQTVAVLISALVFAIAHVIIQGHLASALTFFPAIIMGFLFLKTRSLLAPILFHGIANIFYAILTDYFLS